MLYRLMMGVVCFDFFIATKVYYFDFGFGVAP